MADHSPESPPLARIVRAGLEQGADGNHIIRIAERLTDRRGWSDAEQRRFRDQVAAMIVRYRKRR